MGLSIVVFVPDGVVMASDSIAEMHNQKEDNGFLHTKQKVIFSHPQGYLICTPNAGYVNGLPFSYYLHHAMHMIHSSTNLEDFCNKLLQAFADMKVAKENIVLYVAGVNERNEVIVNLIDKDKIDRINRSNDGHSVYNYHAIGRTLWLDKILLPTTYNIGNETLDFQDTDIDFSKYSLSDAIDFSTFIIKTSYQLDRFAQFKQMVGENISWATLSLDGEITKSTK